MPEAVDIIIYYTVYGIKHRIVFNKLFFFLKNTFRNIGKNSKIIEGLHMPHTQFLLLLTSYIIMVNLLQLLKPNQY